MLQKNNVNIEYIITYLSKKGMCPIKIRKHISSCKIMMKINLPSIKVNLKFMFFMLWLKKFNFYLKEIQNIILKTKKAKRNPKVNFVIKEYIEVIVKKLKL